MKVGYVKAGIIDVDVTNTLNVRLDLLRLSELHQKKNTFVHQILTKNNEGTETEPWPEVTIKNEVYYVDIAQLDKYLQNYPELTPEGLLAQPTNWPRQRWVVKLFSLSKYRSITAIQLLKMKLQSPLLYWPWFSEVSMTSLELSNPNKCIFSHEGKYYTMNEYIFTAYNIYPVIEPMMMMTGVKTDSENEDIVSGTVYVPDFVLVKLYKQKNEFTQDWFINANDTRAKMTYPFIVKNKRKAVFNVPMWNDYQLGAVQDDHFKQVLGDDSKYIINFVEQDPSDQLLALRRVPYYIIGKDWVEIRGKNFVLDHDEIKKSLKEPVLRKKLYKKINEDKDKVDANNGDVHVIGPEGGIWK